MNQRNIGGDFDDFLREEHQLEAAEAAALKRVIAYQVAEAMKERRLSKREMASRMQTSRAALERILDPANTSITLATLGRVAAALGKRLSVSFESTPTPPKKPSARSKRVTSTANRPAAPRRATTKSAGGSGAKQ